MASDTGPQEPVKKPRPVQPRSPQSPQTGPKKAPRPAAKKQQEAEVEAPQQGPLEDYEEPQPSMLREFLRDSPSWLTSLIVHMALLLVLALWMLPKEIIEHPSLSFFPKEVEEEIEEIIEEPPEELEIDVSDVADALPQPETTNMAEEIDFSPADEIEAAAVKVELSPLGERTAPKSDLLTQIGGASGSGLAGRGKAARTALVRQNGGSKGSELAVAKALRWLANHQLPNGSWSFDHRGGLCQGRCPHEGSLANATTAATAMALLPFLGAGQTHVEGEYQKNVRAGLYYLVSQMKVSQAGGDLRGGGGSMYAHGLASIAICEAYAMTQDKGLMAPAQAALNFIVNAQDPVGGGWRYAPKQPGDTSVVGWQMMALKSGHMAYLNVPPNVIKGASAFLDSVQVDSGSGYGYTGPGRGPATSAVGLLCRMYLGWKKDNPAIERGVQWLSNKGPSPGHMYYNYYAAQVMFQATGAKGDVWKKWNDAMRDYLVGAQASEGHMEGSWYMDGDHGAKSGGRLYCTSMATMILEVYYRHMPIFKEAATTEDFPL